jgi:sodium-dependent dicarboxylate transporter 2/3/5
MDESPVRAIGRWRTTTGFILGPVLAICVLLLPFSDLTLQAHRLAAIMVLVIVFWLSEAIPIPVTALLGTALAVVVGVAPVNQVLSAFGDPILLLIIGSFMLARAMQVHGVDRRIAYALLAHPWVGGGAYRMLWAVGLTAWLLAMWIGITASVAMLFPVALAIAQTTASGTTANSTSETPGSASRDLAALLFFLIYAASAGAMATPVGTPPNLIGLALIQETRGVQVGFIQWMAFGIPTALILLVLRYGLVLLLFRPALGNLQGSMERLQQESHGLGPWTAGARNTLVAFGFAIALWIGPGLLGLALGSTHPLTHLVGDRLSPGIAALLAAGLLFLLPADRGRRQGTLRWEEALQIDWGTVLLFGGGIALGRLMFETGLAEAVGTGLLGPLRIGHPVALIGAAVLLAVVLSEIASNTAAANMVIPMMLALSSGSDTQDLSVALAATLGASMGFMLPVSTPANAIIHGSRAIQLPDMVRAGLLVDLIGVLVVWAVAIWLIPAVLATG